MSRPLRVEFKGAVYTAGGNSGLHIYADDLDRNKFLNFLAQELEQQMAMEQVEFEELDGL